MTKLREQDAERRRSSALGPDFSEALARGLQIMTTFATMLRPMSLAEAARAVDLPRATVRRALHTLLQMGYVEADGRLFRMTPQVLRLANAYLTSNMVSTVLQPMCERLTADTGQSCSAAVLDKADVVMIARAVPAQSIAVGAGIGYRLRAANTALGRVLLGALSDGRSFVTTTETLEADTTTQVDLSHVRAAIDDTRVRGYAYVDGEAEIGFRSIAVPVRKFDGSVVAALNLGGHADRLSAERMHGELLGRLLAATEELRSQLL